MAHPSSAYRCRKALAELSNRSQTGILDTDLGSLPEGELVKAMLKQAVEDLLGLEPGRVTSRSLYALTFIEGPKWDHWCGLIGVDADTARNAVMKYR